MKVLFVCRANIGRSQMAEALFNEMTGLKSFSAGTKVDVEDQKIVDKGPLVEPVVRFMKNEGIDVSENKRNLVTQEMIENFDKVIVMAEPETIPGFLKDNSKVEIWVIEDPKGMDDEGYERIVGQLKERIKDFVDENNL